MVRASRAMNGRQSGAVAVATGVHEKSDLVAESPDLLLDDLRQPEQLLDLLL